MSDYYDGDFDISPVSSSPDEEARIERANQLLDHAQLAIEQRRYEAALILLASVSGESLPGATLARHAYLKGWCLTELRRSQVALDELNAALRLAEQAHEHELAARIRNRIGINYYQILQFLTADTHFAKCWSAIQCNEIKDISFKMHIHNNLGNTALRMGKFEVARDFYKQALNYATDLNEVKWVGSICLGLGLACMHIGEFGEAMRAIKIGLALEREVMGDSFAAKLAGMYGMILNKLNQPQAAMRELLNAVELSKKTNNYQILVIAYGNIAEVLLAQEQPEEAQAMAERAVSEAWRLQVADLDIAQLLHTLARVYQHRGEEEQANRTFAAAEALLRKTGDQVKLHRLLFDYARSLSSWHNFERAAQKFSEAVLILNPRLKRYALI